MAARRPNDIRREIGKAYDELVNLARDPANYAAKEAEIAELQGELGRAERALASQAALAQPAQREFHDPAAALPERDEQALYREYSQDHLGRSPILTGAGGVQMRGFGHYLARARQAANFKPDPTAHFRSLGEQIRAIITHYASHGTQTDPRLVRAPTGAGEADPTGGGFLVQTDFSTAIWMRVYDLGEIMSRVNKIPISANANGLKIPAINEITRQNGGRFGGVISSWLGEGDPIPKSKPGWRTVDFDLKKLASLMFVTDELMKDSTALASVAGLAYSEEIMFMVEDAIYEGSGAGQPLGFQTSPCNIVVPKLTGQAAGTILRENIDAMWRRMWSRSRSSSVWTINQDCEPQLNQLNQAVGTGGVLVYCPPGGLSSAPYATLYGRPVVALEYNNTVGTAGDIALVDFTQYTLVDKGGIDFAQSMHFSFNTDEMVLRMTYRVDGKPMWNQALIPFKGPNTVSPYVTLATRG
jgi:HK97 family phage major capsid protein